MVPEDNMYEMEGAGNLSTAELGVFFSVRGMFFVCDAVVS